MSAVYENEKLVERVILVGIRGGGTGKPVSDAVNSYVNIPGSLIVHIKRQKQNLIFQDRRETAGYGFCQVF